MGQNREIRFRTRICRRRVKADRLVGEGQSYREISQRLGLSANTILDIVKRDRAE
jgi:transposase